MNADLDASYRRAERTTAEWARSFYFASRWLPAPKRRAVFALYDYCRHVDNLVDERGTRSIAEVEQSLARVRAEIEAMGDSPATVVPRWLALSDTLERYPVPLTPLLELIDGVSMDLEPVSYPAYTALHRYCRLVAGGVGLMLGPVLGAEPRRFETPGVNLGVAMQLTNMLRDIGEDLDQGRCYLPQDELSRFGLSVSDLERRKPDERFVAFMRFQVKRARRLFADASVVIPLFPTDGSRLTVRLLQQTYAGILDVIEEQNFDVFRRRAYTSSTRKLVILARAWRAERRTSARALTIEGLA